VSEYLIRIGKVASSHGIKGEIKVMPYTDFFERYRRLDRVRMLEYGNRQETRVLKVENARSQGKAWLLKLEGIDTRDAALEIKGENLFILPEERMPLPEDTYYYDQIIGLKVYTREGERLGKVTDILPSGGQDIYLVKDENTGRRYLIPAIKRFLPEINLAEKTIIVDPPEGLLDL